MDKDLAVLRAEADDRGESYALLSRLLHSELDEAVIADLVAGFAVEDSGDALVDEGAALVRSFLDAVDVAARAKSELAIDFSLTFLGYGVDPDKAGELGANAAYPYESFYRTGSKTLGGEGAEAVAATYREKGFAPNLDRIIARDHIACELAFLSFLAQRERDARDAGDFSEAQRMLDASEAFLREHVALWVGAFEKAVDVFSETPFYRGVVRMVRGMVERDAALLAHYASSEGVREG